MELSESAKQFFRAAKSGNAIMLVALLHTDPHLVGVHDADNATKLHLAAWNGHLNAVEAILDAGADVNARSINDHYGDTPFRAAAHGNHHHVVELLVERGADMNARNPASQVWCCGVGSGKLHSLYILGGGVRQSLVSQKATHITTLHCEQTDGNDPFGRHGP